MSNLSFTKEAEEKWLRLCRSYEKATLKITATIMQRTMDRLHSLKEVIEAKGKAMLSATAEDDKGKDDIWKAHLSKAIEQYPSMKTLLRKELYRADRKENFVANGSRKRTEQEKKQRVEKMREHLAQFNQSRVAVAIPTNIPELNAQGEPPREVVGIERGSIKEPLGEQQPTIVLASPITSAQELEYGIPKGRVESVVTLPLITATERHRRGPPKERDYRSYSKRPRTEVGPNPQRGGRSSSAFARGNCPTCGQHMPKATKFHTISNSLIPHTTTLLPARLRPEAAAFVPAHQHVEPSRPINIDALEQVKP